MSVESYTEIGKRAAVFSAWGNAALSIMKIVMGMISGSAVANTAGTGAITIPLMKKSGFQATEAGAIEAIASTGGQLMPPIMGVSAFIIAEIVGVSYLRVALAAALPAILYYSGIYFMVHGYAAKRNIGGLKDVPSLLSLIKSGGYLFIPIILLVYFIVIGLTLMMSALRATVLAIGLSFIKKKTRLSLGDFLDVMIDTGKRAAVVAIPCAAAGFIMGVFMQTGLAAKMATIFIKIGGGNLFLTLLAMAFPCMLLGMGMPTVTAYIIVALLMAPVAIKLGVTPIAAHLFVFYFALMAMVTPPVALAAYTGAGISGADPTTTGVKALQMGFSGFITPFLMVYYPALTLSGDPVSIFLAFGRGIISIYLISGVFTGYYLTEASLFERALAIVGSLLLLTSLHSTLVLIIGGVIFCLLILFQCYKLKKR